MLQAQHERAGDARQAGSSHHRLIWQRLIHSLMHLGSPVPQLQSLAIW